MTNNSDQIIKDVKEYYGEVLKDSSDLQTSACCPTGGMPAYLKPLLDDIHPEIQQKFYGCGSPIPPALDHLKVIDLGCGTGRDCYLMSRLVGGGGQVIGIDMTQKQLDVANKHIDYHTDKYGYQRANIKFIKTYIEDLKSIDILDNSVDVVTSNCVINLSPHKEKVFAEIMRVLKLGGELYFADIFSDRRLALDLKTDPVLVGECLGGALYWEDFRRILAKSGQYDIRVMSSTPLSIENDELKKKLDGINFNSISVRVFKLPLEDRAEDYGHSATYLGNLAESPQEFVLDDKYTFIKDVAQKICANTAIILERSRYSKFFKVSGNSKVHRGLFKFSDNQCKDSQSKKTKSAKSSCC